jgi:hypothetical protein
MSGENPVFGFKMAALNMAEPWGSGFRVGAFGVGSPVKFAVLHIFDIFNWAGIAEGTKGPADYVKGVHPGRGR